LSGERTLRIQLSPSRSLAAIIVVVHGGAAVCAGVFVAGSMGIWLGVLIAGLGIAAAWDRALLRGRRSVRALIIGSGDNVILDLANAQRVGLRISPRRFVSALVVILPGAPWMRRNIVVWRDMLDPDSFRVLRLWALWGRVPDTGTTQPVT